MKTSKLLLFSLALFSLKTFSQNSLEIKKDSTKIVVFGFDNNSTYQFIINYKFYEFKVRRGVAGVFYALFPDSFYENGY
jgi:hypothetical protein